MLIRLTIEDNAEETIRGLLLRLLTLGMVRGVLVPMRVPYAPAVMPSLVYEPARLADAAPLAPVMPISEAAVAGALTIGEERVPLAAVLRPCQMRAFIELVKLRQANCADVLLIGIDCAGTYEVTDFARVDGVANRSGLDLLPGLRAGEVVPHPGYAFRAACRMCMQPFPDQADVKIRFVGVSDPQALAVEANEEVLQKLDLMSAPFDEVDPQAAVRLLACRRAEREMSWTDFRTRIVDGVALLEEFATCVRCLNCMVACPLCYCKECIFRTETFDHHPRDYQRWAERKGLTRLPADTLLFHLTRLNHMSVSCVGCGLCESACPNDLPLTRLFTAVSAGVQQLFDYVPGRSIDEPIPIATFREDELESQ